MMPDSITKLDILGFKPSNCSMIWKQNELNHTIGPRSFVVTIQIGSPAIHIRRASISGPVQREWSA